MEIFLDSSNPFNLDVTLCCGQAFRWDKLGEWWYGVVSNKIVKIRQLSDKLEFENVSKAFIENYFRLKENLTEILKQIKKDKVIEQAIEGSKGLRILRQDPWECLISYICATYKNIGAIKHMLANLCRKFGDKLEFDGYIFYTFPPPEKLASTSTKELVDCGLGYRAKYVSKTAKDIYDASVDLESLKKSSYEEARKKLLAFPGVGLKVADCVLLFSLEKLDAFPVDVWIKRAIIRHYAESFSPDFINRFSCKKSITGQEYEKINSFGRNYFGKYAGYAQEYLYHYERKYNLN